MTHTTGAVYRIQKFATLAGVTVRALHHYDRLGLLKPGGRSPAGTGCIATATSRASSRSLKFLGLPLQPIGRLVKQGAPLAETLRRQQHVLAGKRRQLDLTIQAIAQAERSVQSGRDPDWDRFTTIVKEIEMQNSTDWSKKYYSEDAKAKVEERKALWSPELQAQVTKQWTELVADVTAALEDDPAGPQAQALAARWRTLVEGFTGGDPDVQKGLNTMWADKANWPAQERERFHIDPGVQEFIVTAMKETPPR